MDSKARRMKPWPRVNGTPVRVLPRRFNRIKRLLDLRQPDLIVLMENIKNPHNISAILRTCDAVGVLNVHYISKKPLVLTPRIARGAAQWIALHHHTDLKACIRNLKDQGHQVVATAPGETAVDFREIDYTKPTVILLGNEAAGVSDQAREQADMAIRIPMFGMVHSLNVSVAAAVILYEAERQRRVVGTYSTRRLDPETYQRLLWTWSVDRKPPSC